MPTVRNDARDSAIYDRMQAGETAAAIARTVDLTPTGVYAAVRRVKARRRKAARASGAATWRAWRAHRNGMARSGPCLARCCAPRSRRKAGDGERGSRSNAFHSLVDARELPAGWQKC